MTETKTKTKSAAKQIAIPGTRKKATRKKTATKKAATKHNGQSKMVRKTAARRRANPNLKTKGARARSSKKAPAKTKGAAGARFHVVTGLPRAGSTLLCNLLSQNPRWQASSTSPLPSLLRVIQQFLSNSPEVKSELAADQHQTELRVTRMLRNIVGDWYSDTATQKDVVFDKSRMWTSQAQILEHTFPGARMLCCVRDLRGVFGSIEKQHARFPAFGSVDTPLDSTVLQRADKMFSPTGLVGMPVHGVMDLVSRKWPNMTVVQYEYLVSEPEQCMRSIYSSLKEPWFKGHDFDNVESVATDLDALYLNKFPHDGSGKVAPPEPKEWEKYVPDSVSKLIMDRYPEYNRAFGYTV